MVDEVLLVDVVLDGAVLVEEADGVGSIRLGERELGLICGGVLERNLLDFLVEHFVELFVGLPEAEGDVVAVESVVGPVEHPVHSSLADEELLELEEEGVVEAEEVAVAGFELEEGVALAVEVVGEAEEEGLLVEDLEVEVGLVGGVVGQQVQVDLLVVLGLVEFVDEQLGADIHLHEVDGPVRGAVLLEECQLA